MLRRRDVRPVRMATTTAFSHVGRVSPATTGIFSHYRWMAWAGSTGERAPRAVDFTVQRLDAVEKKLVATLCMYYCMYDVCLCMFFVVFVVGCHLVDVPRRAHGTSLLSSGFLLRGIRVSVCVCVPFMLSCSAAAPQLGRRRDDDSMSVRSWFYPRAKDNNETWCMLDGILNAAFTNELIPSPSLTPG